MRELTLAEKLLRLRGSRQQKQVAIGAGLTPAALCKLEKGERGKSSDSLTRLAAYYSVLPEYLAGDLRTYTRAWAATSLTDPHLRTPGQRLLRVLNELGVRYGVTTAALATELAITPRDLEDYLADRLPTSSHVLRRIETITGIPANWILTGPAAPRWTPDDYQKQIALAIAAGLPPEILEELIRAWIARRDT